MPGSTQTAHQHPTVLAHQRARRANPHLRLADRITTFVGSMSFVYIHGLAIAGWMLLVESNPWPKLTLMVSMEAIFLSSFVLIGQNRQAAFQRDKADHDFLEQEGELKLNTELTRAIHKLATEIHDRLGVEESHRDDDDAGTLLSAATEGSSEVVNPLVGDLPWDEVAAVVVGGEVDHVVPAGAVTGEEMLHALVGPDAGWVFVADEGDATGRLDGWLPAVRGRPRVAVVVGVGAHRGPDGAGDPEDHGVGEQVVFGKDGLDVAAVVAPVHPAFQHPASIPAGESDNP